MDTKTAATPATATPTVAKAETPPVVAPAAFKFNGEQMLLLSSIDAAANATRHAVTPTPPSTTTPENALEVARASAKMLVKRAQELVETLG